MKESLANFICAVKSVLKQILTVITHLKQGQIQDFSKGGTSLNGSLNLLFGQIFLKTAWK